MAPKKQTETIEENAGSLSSKKTNQDFNQKKPALSDPNELKSKTKPETEPLKRKTKRPRVSQAGL